MTQDLYKQAHASVDPNLHQQRHRYYNMLMKTLPIQKSHKNYLLIILILAPMLNFLTGINIDLLSPSLPSIAHYFQISTALAKEIIAI